MLELKNKKRGKKRLINSFKYAIEGLRSTIIREQNMTIHVFIATIIFIVGLFFNLSLNEWMLLALVSGLVMATELINTSIEAVVDLVQPTEHPLAKVAKDTAAAAVLVFAVVAIIMGIFIFLPKIVGLWGVNL